MEEPTSVTFIANDVRDNIGISNYDCFYRTYRCCYCNEPITYTAETQKIMIKKLEMDYLSVNKNLPRDEELRIKNYVEIEKAGLKISHSQHIHFECNAIIHDPRNRALLDIIKQKAHVEIPNTKNSDIRPIPKYRFDADYPCIYCNTQLTEWVPGFRYNLFISMDTINYIHIRCYGILKDKEPPTQKESTSIIIDNDNLPQNPTEWTLDTIITILNEWRELMHQSIQPKNNIEAFIQVLKNIRKNITSPELLMQAQEALSHILVQTNDEKVLFALKEDEIKPKLEQLEKILEVDNYPKISIEDKRKFTYFYNILRVNLNDNNVK